MNGLPKYDKTLLLRFLDGRVLLGLGLGMVITGLVFQLSLFQPDNQSTAAADYVQSPGAAAIEEIKNVSSSSAQTTVNEQETVQISKPDQIPFTETPVSAPQPSQPSQPMELPTATPSQEAVTAPPTIKTSEPVVVEEPKSPSIPEVLSIQVGERDSSESVSRQLAQLGVVQNWSELNSFLVRNSFDRRIQNGIHHFTPGMSMENIANELVRKR